MSVRIPHNIGNHNVHGAHQARRAQQGQGESAATRAGLSEDLIQQLTEIAKQGVDASSFGQLVPHQSAGSDFTALQGDLKNFKTRQALAMLLPELGIQDLKFGVDPKAVGANGDSIVLSAPPSNARGVSPVIEAEILPGVFKTSAELNRDRRAATNPYYALASKATNPTTNKSTTSDSPWALPPVSGSAVNATNNYYDAALASYPQEIKDLEDSIGAALGDLAKLRKGEQVDLTRLSAALGVNVKDMLKDGKLDDTLMFMFTEKLMNKVTERVTQVANIMKSSNDLFQALNSNMRVA